MKLLVVLFALLGFSSATFIANCEECTTIVDTIANYLSGQDSIDRQVGILVAEVCPQSENPDECVENLPEFWGRVAMVLWPGYFAPAEEWMCGGPGPCGAKAPR